MLDREAALVAAAAFLEEKYRAYPDADPVRTMPESAVTDGSDLIVPFNTVAALDHGVEEAELGGNMPIRVDTVTGECSWLHLDEALSYYGRGSDT